MKYTLKDYQQSAVTDVLERLRKARKWWNDDSTLSAFSLTAVTGAGKTVMAAAVFEALFFEDDEFDFEPDPGAVVLWFSDSPNLNEQTRFRLLSASNKLKTSHMVKVADPFPFTKLEPRKIYFLNTQKLGKNSNLVRGNTGEGQFGNADSFPGMPPDAQQHSIWDIIRNTVDDPDLTLYFVLDEAHRGMGSNGNAASWEADRSTIVKRLINGTGPSPAMPVVWGISATVERFDMAMKAAAATGNRTVLPNVVVDPALVQESGLLKDTIVLDIPDEKGEFDAVLVRRATDKLMASDAAWAEYATQQDDADAVRPLMVLQVENTPKAERIGELLDVIFERWPELPTSSVAHVFSDTAAATTFGSYPVPHIPPEQVQDATWVRVLIAKTAISTGWDCPRAEVMVSLRSSTTDDYITQLIGRTLRTPLARRIPGDEVLNSVHCLLPYFDRKAVDRAVGVLKNGPRGDEPVPGREVLVNPIEVTPNSSMPDEVWEVFESLPTQTIPKNNAKPVKRFTLLAHELAADGLLADAGKIAHGELHKVLDAARIKYSAQIEAARKSVLTVEGKTITTGVLGTGKSLSDFSEEADRTVIEDAYKRACRTLGADLCRTYADHLAAASTDENDDEEDRLLDAHTVIAALGLVPEVKEYLEPEAQALGNSWFTKYRTQVKKLSDERRNRYDEIKAFSAEPQDVDLAKPKSQWVPTTLRGADGIESPLTTYSRHLLSDSSGNYPVPTHKLTSWEQKALDKEVTDTDLVAWYRNPSGSRSDALSITYVNDGVHRLVRPDFLVFTRNRDGAIGVSIVDPHGHHLPEAMDKLRGLATYAEQHAGVYQRIDSIAEIGKGKFRVLDLTDQKVRAAIIGAGKNDAKKLYESDAATDYV